FGDATIIAKKIGKSHRRMRLQHAVSGLAQDLECILEKRSSLGASLLRCMKQAEVRKRDADITMVAALAMDLQRLSEMYPCLVEFSGFEICDAEIARVDTLDTAIADLAMNDDCLLEERARLVETALLSMQDAKIAEQEAQQAPVAGPFGDGTRGF